MVDDDDFSSILIEICESMVMMKVRIEICCVLIKEKMILCVCAMMVKLRDAGRVFFQNKMWVGFIRNIPSIGSI